MRIELANGQHVPYVRLTNGKKEVMRIYFCKDGGIIQLTKDGKDISIGTNIGVRLKNEQTDYEDADSHDGIIIGEI